MAFQWQKVIVLVKENINNSPESHQLSIWNGFLSLSWYSLIINGMFEVSKSGETEIQMKWSVKHLKVLLVRTSLNSRLFSFLSHLKSFIMTVVSYWIYTRLKRFAAFSFERTFYLCISIRSNFNSFMRKLILECKKTKALLEDCSSW
jgi:hypothetical protein